MAAALFLIDVIKDFLHEDGERLLASYRARHGDLVLTVERARSEGLAVVYANDNADVWDSDAPELVRRAVEEGKAGELVARVAPRPGETVVLKPGYSAFHETPLRSILRTLDVNEIVLAGTATEMCVFQTATDGVRLGFELAVEARACATVDEQSERLALDFLERVLGIDVRR